MTTEPYPLGVIPYRYYWANHVPSFSNYIERTTDLIAAVARYRKAGLEPLPEWFEELSILAAEVKILKD